MKNYCHLCGAKYIEGKTQPWECSGCGNLSYSNSIPCAEIVLFDELGRVLLALRGEEPNKGMFDLPGGFINLDEVVEVGLAREIEEELGLVQGDYTEPAYCMSWAGDDYKFSKEIAHTLNLVFMAKIINKEKLKAHDDVAEVEFIEIDKLDSIEFSWAGYPALIRKAHRQIFF